MSKKNPQVDVFFKEAALWRVELLRLRDIVLACGLTEELKWSKPCYSVNGSNVVIIQEFKPHCALLFCKGALLKDARGILKKPGENTQAARRVEITDLRELIALEPVLKAYIHEAIAAEKAGLEVEYKKGPEPVPAELKKKLAESPALKTAFAALTPGRQRAYILFFSAAKQSQTEQVAQPVDNAKPKPGFGNK